MQNKQTVIQVIALGGFALAITTGCWNPKPPKQVQSDLDSLVNIFAISFPTNALKREAASWDYRAALDGNSQNTETLAKLEVPVADFRAWRETLTNRMEEYSEFGASPDPRLSKRLPWWDPHKWPSTQVTYYSLEVHQKPDSFERLSIYTIPKGSNVLVYIYGFRSQR